MTPADLARIHAVAMAGGRPWSSKSFEELLSDSVTILITEPQGFALGRVMAEETELLTLAVLPAAQGRGLGRKLLGRFEAEAITRGAKTGFLEVAEDNLKALRLYEKADWEVTSRRADYYSRDGSDPVDAILLSKQLSEPRV